MDTTELVFDDLDPIEVPVKIKGKLHMLVEPSEDAVCKWRNVMIRAAKMSDGKVIGLDSVSDGEPFLVSMCLYTADTKGEFQRNTEGRLVDAFRVPITVIRTWPSRVVAKLFEKLKEIGNLDEDETEEGLTKQRDLINEKLAKVRAKVASTNTDQPKNETSATTDTSV